MERWHCLPKNVVCRKFSDTTNFRDLLLQRYYNKGWFPSSLLHVLIVTMDVLRVMVVKLVLDLHYKSHKVVTLVFGLHHGSSRSIEASDWTLL